MIERPYVKDGKDNGGLSSPKDLEAEIRRWWWRSLVIGVAGGVTLEALSAIPWLTDWVLGAFS